MNETQAREQDFARYQRDERERTTRAHEPPPEGAKFPDTESVMVPLDQFRRIAEAMNDAQQSLKRLPDVDGAFRVTCISEIQSVLRLPIVQKYGGLA